MYTTTRFRVPARTHYLAGPSWRAKVEGEGGGREIDGESRWRDSMARVDGEGRWRERTARVDSESGKLRIECNGEEEL